MVWAPAPGLAQGAPGVDPDEVVHRWEGAERRRGLVAGIVSYFAVIFTLGILLLMPFWDSRDQNLWDKISSTHVVSDPNDAWSTKPNPMGG